MGALLCAGFAPAAPALPTQFLDLAGGRLAYDDTGGDGPLVIAVPGMGDRRQEYRYLSPFLTAAGYRVVTLDLRGMGESSANFPDVSARAIGDDMVRLERHLHRSSAILIGNSFAGGAPVWAAHDAPGSAAALVLLDPVLRDPPGKSSWSARLMMRIAFAGPWNVRLWLRYWDTLFVTRTPPDQVSYRAALGRDLRQPGRMAALQAMVLASKAPTAAIVGATGIPTLVVMGSDDPDVDDPAAEARWIGQRMAAKVTMVAGAGHYPHVEMPDRVGPAIVAFLATRAR